MDKQVLFDISYGLYVLSVNDGKKDNGCIINTAMQITENPLCLVVGVNKMNYTESIMERTDDFNLAILSESAPFSMFKQFGFQSGKDINKYSEVSHKRDINGIAYPDKNVVSLISCKIKNRINCGTHTLFLADIKDLKSISKEKPVTYSYYHKNIKEKKNTEGKKGWRCKICGYIYEGEELPEDYICPICKHGASDFERI